MAATSARKLYILAGEASGDLHAANLLAALRAQSPAPLEVRGMGGDLLAAQGMTVVKHIRETNFMGFWTVVKNLPAIRRMFSQVKADVLANMPDAVILVDYPGFNLRMARFFHGLGIPVLYYISPQLWAWKEGRVRQVRRYVQHMYTILPFEPDFYARHGIAATYLGHPLLDALAAWQPHAPTLSLLAGQPGPVVALLPGSRPQEVRTILPRMLAACSQLPGFVPVVAGAPALSPDFYQPLLAGSNALLVHGQTYTVVSQARVALVASGTATLETALLGTPQVVGYAGGWLSFQIARRLVKVPYISLVNLIANRPVVQELIQYQLTPEALAAAAIALAADGPERAAMLAEYDRLRQVLGSGGASQRYAVHMLGQLGWG